MAEDELTELASVVAMDEVEYAEPVYFAGTHIDQEDEFVDMPSDASVEDME